ncbi:MAG TPA: hypothetical protein VFV38_39830 [Ktedonobacteraceae bacterium]|nr:hypothetical protein [Ktedonobacteraceae bacterium]
MDEQTSELSFEEEDEIYNQMVRDLQEACARRDFPAAEMALWKLERRFPDDAVLSRLVFTAVSVPDAG